MIQSTVTGNLGRDPETRVTNAGKAMASFSVGSSSKGRDGEYETTWVEVTCFEAVAEGVDQNLKKGDKVVVTGNLKLETFEKRDGTQGTSLRMIANDIGKNVRLPKQVAAQEPVAETVPW